MSDENKQKEQELVSDSRRNVDQNIAAQTENAKDAYEHNQAAIDDNYEAAKNTLKQLEEKDVNADETARDTVAQGSYVTFEDALKMVDAESAADKQLAQAKFEMIKTGGKKVWSDVKDMGATILHGGAGFASTVWNNVGEKGLLASGALGLVGLGIKNWADGFNFLDGQNETDVDAKYVPGASSDEEMTDGAVVDNGGEEADADDKTVPGEETVVDAETTDDVLSMNMTELGNVLDGIGDSLAQTSPGAAKILSAASESLTNEDGLLNNIAEGIAEKTGGGTMQMLGTSFAKLLEATGKSTEAPESESEEQYEA